MERGRERGRGFLERAQGTCSHSKIAVQLWRYIVACLSAHLRICTSTKTLPCMCMHSDACMRACASPSHTGTPTRAHTRYRPEVRLRGVRIHLRGFPGGQWLKEQRGRTERRGGGSEPERVRGRVCAQVGKKSTWARVRVQSTCALHPLERDLSASVTAAIIGSGTGCKFSFASSLAI